MYILISILILLLIGATKSASHIPNKESEKAGCFKNLYNGGNCVTEVKKEKLRIKQEHIDGWSSAKVQPRQQPQFQNNLNIQQQMLNNPEYRLCSKHPNQLPDPDDQSLHHLTTITRFSRIVRA